MNKEHKALKAGIWYVLSQLFVRSISFLATPIFSRLLTTAQFGQVKLFESWLQILLPILTLSLYSSVEKAFYEFPDKFDEYLSSIQFLSFVSLIFFCLFVIPFGKPLKSLLSMNDFLLIIAFLYCFTHSSILIYQKKEKLFYRYKSNIVLTLILTFSSFAVAILAVVWGIKVESLDQLAHLRIVGFYIPQIIIGIFIIVFLLKKGKCFFNKNYWKFALKFSLPMIPYYISLQILNQSDKIMIEKLSDASKVGLFSLASTLMYILYLLQTSIGDAFLPWLFEKLDAKEYKEISPAWMIIILGCSYLSWIIVLYAPEVVKILGGEKYHEAIYLVSPILCSALFNFFSVTYTNIERFYQQTKLIALSSIFAVILNLTLNYWGIIKFGYVAAAYTTIFCYFVMIIVHGIMVKYISGQYIVSLWKILSISVIIFIVNTLTMYLYNTSFVIRILIGLISALVIVLFEKNKLIQMKQILKK